MGIVTLARLLERKRLALKLSNRAFAERELGVTHPTWLKFRKGKTTRGAAVIVGAFRRYPEDWQEFAQALAAEEGEAA